MSNIFVGKIVGTLTVLCEENSVLKIRKRKTWKCQCTCGTIVYASTNNLNNRPNRSCGTCVVKRKPKQDLTNQKFGRLLVLSPELDENRKRQFTWKCQCDCGKYSYVITNALKSGHTKSCGCGELDNIKKIFAAGRENRTKNRKDPKLQLSKWLFDKNYSDGDLKFEHFLSMSQEKCFYCDCLPANRLKFSSRSRTQEYRDASLLIYNGLDRINNDLPHNLDNVVPCCKNCNFAKRDRKYDDFVQWINKTYNNLKNKNIL